MTFSTSLLRAVVSLCVFGGAVGDVGCYGGGVTSVAFDTARSLEFTIGVCGLTITPSNNRSAMKNWELPSWSPVKVVFEANTTATYVLLRSVDGARSAVQSFQGSKPYSFAESPILLQDITSVPRWSGTVGGIFGAGALGLVFYTASGNVFVVDGTVLDGIALSYTPQSNSLYILRSRAGTNKGVFEWDMASSRVARYVGIPSSSGEGPLAIAASKYFAIVTVPNGNNTGVSRAVVVTSPNSPPAGPTKVLDYIVYSMAVIDDTHTAHVIGRIPGTDVGVYEQWSFDQAHISVNYRGTFPDAEGTNGAAIAMMKPSFIMGSSVLVSYGFATNVSFMRPGGSFDVMTGGEMPNQPVMSARRRGATDVVHFTLTPVPTTAFGPPLYIPGTEPNGPVITCIDPFFSYVHVFYLGSQLSSYSMKQGFMTLLGSVYTPKAYDSCTAVGGKIIAFEKSGDVDLYIMSEQSIPGLAGNIALGPVTSRFVAGAGRYVFGVRGNGTVVGHDLDRVGGNGPTTVATIDTRGFAAAVGSEQYLFVQSWFGGGRSGSIAVYRFPSQLVANYPVETGLPPQQETYTLVYAQNMMAYLTSPANSTVLTRNTTDPSGSRTFLTRIPSFVRPVCSTVIFDLTCYYYGVNDTPAGTALYFGRQGFQS